MDLAELELRLSAALNHLLQQTDLQQTYSPWNHIANHLRNFKQQNATPQPTPPTNQHPNLDTHLKNYLETHKVRQTLETLVNQVKDQEDPLTALATALDKVDLNNKFKTTADVRRGFVEFFESKAGHVHWASSPVVPLDDPTLLFINAGMNQFKPIFLGQVDPHSKMAQLRRAANSQKCIRAGGKHNDLDDVGKDVYHHTFFEMLGNWSFGDYFKKEAIDWAWELLTSVYGIDPDRLYASYFEGNDAINVPMDTEARDYWLQYLPPERVLPFGMEDNFWEMGETGPCGPCSEIHYDRIGGRDAASLVNADDPTVIEIWNLVFMQFNRELDKSLTLLPAPCVDTGMGLERVASVLLDKMSNYDIDLFTNIFKAIQALVPGLRDYTGKVGEDDVDLVDTAYRVVADHIRTLTFAMTDGANPSNEGRGYVLRRVLRRAVRYGTELLKAPEGFFHNLVDIVVEQMGDAFPELHRNPAAIKEIIRDEEATFSKTLSKGIKTLEKYCANLKSGDRLSAEDAFRMYDTFGFPIDLTILMCEEKGIDVDKDGYDQEMTKARELASARRSLARLSVVMEAEQTDHLKNKLGVPATDDSPKFEWRSAEGEGDVRATKIMAVIDSEKQWHDKASSEAGLVGVVLDTTPFYSEAGGQVADIGTLAAEEDGLVFTVNDVQRFGAYVVHIGRVESGTLCVGASVSAKVDFGRRALVAKNHTTTHMLNLAIMKAVGSACDQRGSLVDPDKLRFDFASNKGLSIEQVADIQKRVNQIIEEDLSVQSAIVPLDGAQSINGLRAVFGEQYPDPVRVVSVGGPGVLEMMNDPKKDEWGNFSIEFCGGTHLTRSSEAGSFVLFSEESVGGGVRRITGATHKKSAEAAAAALELGDRLTALEGIKDHNALTKQTAAFSQDLVQAAIALTERTVLSARLDQLKKKSLKAAKYVLRKQMSKEFQDFLKKLLDPEPETRLSAAGAD